MVDRTSRNEPTAAAKSRTARARQWPWLTSSPEARTVGPAGAVRWTSKSDVGDVGQKESSRTGASVAHPDPFHANNGKNETSRSEFPP
jgi:hypothetical protein